MRYRVNTQVQRRYTSSSIQSDNTSTLSRINLALETSSRSKAARAQFDCKHGSQHNESNLYPVRTYSSFRLQQAFYRPANQANTCSRSSPLPLSRCEGLCSGTQACWPACFHNMLRCHTVHEQPRYLSPVVHVQHAYCRSRDLCSQNLFVHQLNRILLSSSLALCGTFINSASI